MPYQSECLSVLKSTANIHKPFEKTFMDTMKLFMAIPDRINILQLGRCGCFSEQTYRNLFEHETFDWFAFNGSFISKYLTGKRKGIAIDPSYIPKSDKKTPWIGYFWSGRAGEYKRGLEIMGIGVIDIDNLECITLGSIQTPDGKQHAGIINCQSTDFRKLDFHFKASLAAINLAKAACKRLGITYSISSCKPFIHNAYMLERFICVFWINPDPQVIDKLFKEIILFTARAA